MKLVLQIAGGLLLAGLVVTVLGVACVALLAKGVSDVVSNVQATQTAVAPGYARFFADGATAKAGTATADADRYRRFFTKTPTP